MQDSRKTTVSTKGSQSILYGCSADVDVLGILDLGEGEECLHVVGGSFTPRSHNPGHTCIVGTKGVHIRGGDGDDWRIRIPYEYLSRWHVHDHHWHRGLHGTAEYSGYWEVDSLGLSPDRFVSKSDKIHFHVLSKERRKYQGKDSWYMAVERLITAYKTGDMQGVDDVYRGFLKASRVTSSPLGSAQAMVMRFECKMIIPFCEVPGECVVSSKTGMRFAPYCSDALGRVHATPEALLSYRKRRYILNDNGCEVYFRHDAGVESMFLLFSDAETVDLVLENIGHLASSPMCGLETAQQMWRMNMMSNFEYILYLNDYAGRSFKNIYRYPIFPWVLSDYSSSSLDLGNPNVFRDFTKPAASLNNERIRSSLEIFEALAGSGIKHPWMHGSHYSNPGTVVFFRVRQNPKLMLRLQGRKFDQPNRIFYSIESSWKSVCSTSGNDVKEMIPELYDLRHGPSLLENSMGVQLGTRSDGRALGDVELPPWADSAKDFLTKMRMALESEYVSKHIPSWIDLVFGINSRGRQAEKHHNLFHYMTYDEMYVTYDVVFLGIPDSVYLSVSLSACRAIQEIHASEESTKHALSLEAREYGRTPPLVFSDHHPRKHGRRSPFASCFCASPVATDSPDVYL